MNKQEIRETLEKQFHLLSERSQTCLEESELDGHSDRIISLAELLLPLS